MTDIWTECKPKAASKGLKTAKNSSMPKKLTYMVEMSNLVCQVQNNFCQ